MENIFIKIYFFVNFMKKYSIRGARNHFMWILKFLNFYKFSLPDDLQSKE